MHGLLSVSTNEGLLLGFGEMGWDGFVVEVSVCVLIPRTGLSMK